MSLPKTSPIITAALEGLNATPVTTKPDALKSFAHRDFDKKVADARLNALFAHYERPEPAAFKALTAPTMDADHPEYSAAFAEYQKAITSKEYVDAVKKHSEETARWHAETKGFKAFRDMQKTLKTLTAKDAEALTPAEIRKKEHYSTLFHNVDHFNENATKLAQVEKALTDVKEKLSTIEAELAKKEKALNEVKWFHKVKWLNPIAFAEYKVRIQEKAQCLTDQKRCLADNAPLLTSQETLSTEIEVHRIAQNVKKHLTQDAVDAAIKQKQAVLNAVLEKSIARSIPYGIYALTRQAFAFFGFKTKEEGLEAYFESNARFRNVLFVFFGVFGAIAGFIYAASFMADIFNPPASTVASAPFMAEAWFKTSYVLGLGVWAVGIEVFCCAIGLPSLVDAALSYFLPRNYDEYLQQQLAKEDLKFETVAAFDADTNTLVERQVLKQKFKEPWFKWLTRVATAPFLLVGIMGTNAFGSFLFVTRSINKILGGTPATLPFAILAGIVMSIASLVFNLRRAISMLPEAPYGEVRMSQKGGIEWATPEIEKAATVYANMSVFTWMGNGLASIGDGFNWLMNNKWKATKITAGAILAMVLGGALAFVTIASLGSPISAVLSLDMAYGAGLAVFAFVSSCVLVTQYLALKGSMDDGFKPDAIQLLDAKAGTYTLGGDSNSLCTVTPDQGKTKIFFDEASDWASEKILGLRIGNGPSVREFFAYAGQWITADKGLAQSLSLLPAVLTASASAALLGFPIGGPAGSAIAVALTVTLMITFGVANFVLYNFDTRGDRTFESGLAAFAWGVKNPSTMCQNFGSWCRDKYYGKKGYEPVPSTDLSMDDPEAHAANVVSLTGSALTAAFDATQNGTATNGTAEEYGAGANPDGNATNPKLGK